MNQPDAPSMTRLAARAERDFALNVVWDIGPSFSIETTLCFRCRLRRNSGAGARSSCGRAPAIASSASIYCSRGLVISITSRSTACSRASRISPSSHQMAGWNQKTARTNSSASSEQPVARGARAEFRGRGWRPARLHRVRESRPGSRTTGLRQPNVTGLAISAGEEQVRFDTPRRATRLQRAATGGGNGAAARSRTASSPSRARSGHQERQRDLARECVAKRAVRPARGPPETAAVGNRSPSRRSPPVSTSGTSGSSRQAASSAVARIGSARLGRCAAAAGAEASRRRATSRPICRL